jgi:nitric oxide reductase activation protein
MYGDSGDERYSASLALAQKQLAARPERTKVIIYLLDGRPTDEPADAVRHTVEHLRRAGTLVIGLFVGGQGEIRYLRDIFGVDDTIGVEDIRHLPDRLGRILLRYARKR